ncbi:MAG: response regulator transcription factor [Ignavibacterium sp.]
MTFLIVDDSRIMRETLCRIVAGKGDRVIECEDGEQALALYETHRPDWVLMDISMKEVNGIEATVRITRSDPGARVVVVTDFDDRFFRKAAKEAGAVGFVSKENLKEIRTLISNPQFPSRK